MIANNRNMIHIAVTAAEAVSALVVGLDRHDWENRPPCTANGGDMVLTLPAGVDGRVEAHRIGLMTEPEDEEAIVDRFTSGNCAAFAHALWLVNGRSPAIQISVLVDEDGEPHSDEFPDCHTHVYVDTPDACWDVVGRRDPAEMAEDFSLISWTTIGPWGPEEFRRTFTGHGDEPLYCDDDEIARAIAHIRRHPERYTIFQGERA